MQDVEKIAEGLTELEREWVTGWQGARGAAFNCVATDLHRKGLLKGPIDWNLNDLGKAVRDRLKRSAATEARWDAAIDAISAYARD